ncbi:Hint domain-containing protein [Albidovulum inexpectatum]|uniref:Hint domain-containing protein n=2 Tax=Albidovulum inexpectatum TaxID=196587 RepID=A0A2S5JJ15_9RHOB|nr:Hint domain-containing protein [Albidovulum inexpectatum]
MREVPRTPCFTAGTMIATDRGSIRIEDLRVGDRVLTRDRGYRPIRWIGARRFDCDALVEHPELRPILIPAGALGQGVPATDLIVSPQHRILLSGNAAKQLSDETEILVAAVDAMQAIGARRADLDEVVYYHILFDGHEIILSNGCWSESFHPCRDAIAGLHDAQRQEILAIFPELANPAFADKFSPARLCWTPSNMRHETGKAA